MKKIQKAGLLILGFFALIWFLIRVIPKPDRAAYPCQRTAFPIASGFVVWLAGVIGSATIFKNLKKSIGSRKYWIAGLLVVPSLIAVMAIAGFPVIPSAANQILKEPNKPLQEPNVVIGEAKGIFPGRVVWTFDPKSATWDGVNGHYWDDANTNQERIDNMLSSSLQDLTGKNNDKAAWDAIFRYFNKTYNESQKNYSEGEKVVIKINMNTARHGYDIYNYENPNAINATPQVVIAMVSQLVNNANIPDSCIIVFDGSRYITDHIYIPCRKKFPGLKMIDKYGEQGRIEAQWMDDQITYAAEHKNSKRIARCIIESDYIINMAIMKGHNCAGITACGKNHYGSLNGSLEHYYIKQMDRGPGVYNTIVDLMGHKELGLKTLLFMIDGIYGSYDADPPPVKWKMDPFNDHWPSSIFLSLDNVAIESVCWDFFNTEIGDIWYMKYSDSYLREAALADNPPSNSFYAPNGDGVRLQSLGVHEHWNNATGKKYSRNLGTGNGIELIYEKIDN